MRTSAAETIQRNNKIKGVVALSAEIRERLDNGHYNFMTWGGRTKLAEKLSEYENYAREPHRSRSAAVISSQKHRLKEMEAELRALLGSTY